MFLSESMVSERYFDKAVTIWNFIVENDISLVGIDKAYIMAMGVPPNTHDCLEEEIYILAKLISDETNKGFPLNIIATISMVRGRYETSEEDFIDFVNSLNTSRREKEVLKSIVQKCRYGVLVISGEYGSCGLDLKIPYGGKDKDPKEFAYALLESLESFAGEEVSVTFED